MPAPASAPAQAAPSAARSTGRRQTPCMLRRKQRRAEARLAARVSEPQGSLLPAARPTAPEAPAQVASTSGGRKRRLCSGVVQPIYDGFQQPAQQSVGDRQAAMVLLSVAAGSGEPGRGTGGQSGVHWGCPAGLG
jgi:hypothetical protein